MELEGTLDAPVTAHSPPLSVDLVAEIKGLPSSLHPALVRVMTMAATATRNIERAHSEFTTDLSRNSDPDLINQIHIPLQSATFDINVAHDNALGAIHTTISDLETAKSIVDSALIASQYIVDSLKMSA